MPVEFICDGCGKKKRGWANHSGDWQKPPLWFQRTDSDGTQVACSRACIETIAKKTGKTSVVLPI